MYSHTRASSDKFGHCIDRVKSYGDQLILRTFNLEDDDADNVRVFVNELQSINVSIHTLDITNSRINAECMRVLSEIHPTHATFEEIHYSNDDTTSLCLSYFVDLIVKCKRLRMLNCNSPLFTQDLGVARLAMNAMLGMPNLTVLHLVNDTLTPEIFPVVAACLATNTRLTTLHLSGARLGTSFTDHASKFLGNPNWTHLNLHWMNLGDTDFAVIAAAITANPNLTKLNILANLAASVGYAPLLEAMTASTSLRSVHMSILHDIASFLRVSALIRTNTSITSLCLQALIREDGVEETRQYCENTPMLTLAMLDNTTIQKLRLPAIPIGSRDANLFIKFMLVNQTVQCFRASNNSPRLLKSIESMTMYNGVLTKIPKSTEKSAYFATIKARNKTNHLRKHTTFTNLLIYRTKSSKRNRR